MSKSQRLSSILNRARGKEKRYEWLEAAKLYEQASSAVGKRNSLKAEEIQEKIGHCFYRDAFQAESQEEFKKRMRLSVKAYGEAPIGRIMGLVLCARKSFYTDAGLVLALCLIL